MNTCVKCAKCNPHCPPFRESYDEVYSPRGYLYLCELLDSQRLEASQELKEVLQTCTLCKECEKVCPFNLDITQTISSTIEKISKTLGE